MDAQGILDKVNDIKKENKDQYLLDKSKGTVTSALIGGGLGFLIAYNRGWNKLAGTIIGAVIAGFASNYFVNKK